MSELLFLGIAISAGTLKIIAMLIGIMWAFQSFLSWKSVPVTYRYSRTELPFRTSTAWKR